MSVIDFILNITALLLWVSWRYVPFDPLTKTKPGTMTGTLRPANARSFRAAKFFTGIGSLLAIIALLLARALLYWWVGGALSWTPAVNLGAISISFRSDLFGRMMVFSAASFAHLLVMFYLWLLLLSLLNPRGVESDSPNRFLRIQLGGVHFWPWPVKALLPFFLVLLLWLLPGYLLGVWGIVPMAPSWMIRVEQGILLGLSAYLAWKYAIAAVLGLHLLNTYVHLGSQPVWNFINATARRLLTPLRALPLRLGKMDLAPLVAIALVFAAAELIQNGIHRQLPDRKTQIIVPGLVDIYRKISG